MSDTEQLPSDNRTKHNHEQEKLWKELRIDFRLESFGFPDNKIYGIVKVIPESSRKLIETFVLVVNKTNRIEFDCRYKTIAASGLNTKRKNPQAYIEAIPKNKNWTEKMKKSDTCNFYFSDVAFSLNPTISFEWLDDEEDPRTYLIIQWSHIGDSRAQKYILCLDGAEIQYIRQKQINDAFEVKIDGFKPGETHTFELIAKTNNGKETCRSDLMHFTVPDKGSIEEGSVEFINITDEPMPPNLPIIPFRDEENEKEFKPIPNTKYVDPPPSPPPPIKPLLRKLKPCTCCKHLPHNKFPGIQHYFNDTTLVSPRPTSPLRRGKKPEIDDHDDDNDVIITINFK
ncbi:hypothetical protein I4U23_025752 [Adineta vaga]|nr:hypothetical protein I4U23_025752 [Adineta vaga]